MGYRHDFTLRKPWLGALFVIVQCILSTGATKPWTSRPGGAGYAMLFDDSVIAVQGLKGMPAKGLDEFTFEAWISSTDTCHESTIMSYSRKVETKDALVQDAASNHFVICNSKDLIACHDFPILRSTLDTSTTCAATFKMQRPRSPFEAVDDSKDDAPTPISVVSRDNGWHHIAVTWMAANNGTTSIYVDGALRVSAETGKLQPILPDGILMLGQDQDCFGGCTDPYQAFYGLMDEVRLWQKARTHDQIAHSMRYAYGLEKDQDLLAYWKFDDPDDDGGQWKSHKIAKDSGPHGNDLQLINPPQVFSPKNATKPITQEGKTLDANQLVFQRNYLLGLASDVPAGSFTLEFWARGAALPPSVASSSQQLSMELSETYFSYSTTDMPGFSGDPPKSGVELLKFMDDALKVERVLVLGGEGKKPAGLIRVSVNSNSQAGVAADHRALPSLTKQQMVEFDAGWMDDAWHHVAVTWDESSGLAKVYLDGQAKPEVGKGATSFGKQSATRVTKGSLTIGMDQNCFMGCFDENSAANGAVAAMRLWGLVRNQADIQKTMWDAQISSTTPALSWQLLFRDQDSTFHFNYNFTFSSDRLFPMRFDSPRPAYVYSTAPLTLQSGAPVPAPQAGAAGTALVLSDMQLVMVPKFKNFPSTAITVEFWIKTMDKCRMGSPFSYATGDYGNGDNTFLITNQMDWIISVMQDQGKVGESSGVSSANGQWQHIAVTWEQSTGRTILYQNANPMWWVERNKGGKALPPNGTLVIGREQDCKGGCFDSARGAVGRTSTPKDEEYGAQDFFGSIEEMRVWKIPLDALDIRNNIQWDVGSGGHQRGIDPRDPNLVAYWKFDEGTGYTVKDETPNGNDLLIMSEPRWEVVKWLSFCGDGIVSGDEECDDANDENNDGCTRDCHVAPGYYCETSIFPSMCYKIEGLNNPPSPPQPPQNSPNTLPPRSDPEFPTPQPRPTPSAWPNPQPQPSTSGSGSTASYRGSTSSKGDPQGQSTKKEGMSGGMIFLTVLLCLLGVVGAGVAWMQRDVLFASVAHLLPGRQQRDGWSAMATDLEELNLGFRPHMQAGEQPYAPVPPGPQEPHA